MLFLLQFRLISLLIVDGLRLSAFAIFLMLSPVSKLSCRYFLSFSVKCVYGFILTSVSVFVGSIILHLGRYEIYFFYCCTCYYNLPVIKLIEEMPSADEIDAKLMEYEDAEDYEGYEEYYKEIVLQVKSVYGGYRALTDREKAAVTNADKLLELEYIWSREILLDEINSDAPTLVPATGTDPVVSTSEFVKLNIYDYYSTSSAAAAGKKNINTLWSGNDKYPGFQWNGGAYMISSAFSRSIVDNIDFGNSVITDIVYGGTTSGITNGISQNRTNVGRQGGLINDIIQYPTGYWANKPTGISVGNTVMYPTLKNGYPALADGTSLSYLFSENIYAAKKNNSNIDGLFRQNQTSGEYWFDSRKKPCAVCK